MELLASDDPALALARPSGVLVVCYLIGDASGSGFGSALWDDKELLWELGYYGPGHRKESSKFREADNLVTWLEQLEREGHLEGSELFVFTDNLSFEGTFYKGHSTSEKLCDITLRLRLVQQRTG